MVPTIFCPSSLSVDWYFSWQRGISRKGKNQKRRTQKLRRLLQLFYQNITLSLKIFPCSCGDITTYFTHITKLIMSIFDFFFNVPLMKCFYHYSVDGSWHTDCASSMQNNDAVTCKSFWISVVILPLVVVYSCSCFVPLCGLCISNHFASFCFPSLYSRYTLMTILFQPSHCQTVIQPGFRKITAF